MTRGDLITQDDLPFSIQENKVRRKSAWAVLEQRVAAYEQKLICEALNKASGVQTKAAELQGLSEQNLRYKLKKHLMK